MKRQAGFEKFIEDGFVLIGGLTGNSERVLKSMVDNLVRSAEANLSAQLTWQIRSVDLSGPLSWLVRSAQPT